MHGKKRSVYKHEIVTWIILRQVLVGITNNRLGRGKLRPGFFYDSTKMPQVYQNREVQRLETPDVGNINRRTSFPVFVECNLGV